MSILNKFSAKGGSAIGGKKSKKDEALIEDKKSASISPNPHKSALLVKQTWITEKAGNLSGLGKYSFIINEKANKPEIKKTIEQIYGVKVVSINMVNIKGKPRRMGRTMGRSSAYKKAIVTLKEGQKIDVMPT